MATSRADAACQRHHGDREQRAEEEEDEGATEQDRGEIAQASPQDLFLFYYSGHADARGLRLGEEIVPFSDLKQQVREKRLNRKREQQESLRLRGCSLLTDAALQCVTRTCPRLRELDLTGVELPTLTLALTRALALALNRTLTLALTLTLPLPRHARRLDSSELPLAAAAHARRHEAAPRRQPRRLEMRAGPR